MDAVTSGFVLTLFVAGLLSFFTPCILPLLPVFLGYLSGADASAHTTGRASVLKALAFTSGLSVAFFLLGFGAGALGGLFNSPAFFIACGAIVILFGIHQTGIISLPFLARETRLTAQFDPKKGLGGAFLLGFFFSFGWTPCVGPVLGAVLGISSQQGSALTAGGLLLVYSFGLSLPFIILALGSQQLLQRVKGIYPHFGKLRLVGGLLIMGMGAWMIYNQVSILRAEKALAATAVYSSVNSTVYERMMPGLDREPASLAQFKGKKVYVKFWTTWCPSCLAGLEDFTALSKQTATSPDIAVISIVTPGINGEVSKEDFTEWARAQNLSFPIYFDESGTVSREFAVRAYPTAVYLTKDGAVMKKMIGDEPNDAILKMLSNR